MNERRLFALHMYLLLHQVALAEPWDVLLPAGAWARALDKTNAGAEATVSRNWQWLKKQNLVRTVRSKRMVHAHLLNEDGSGDEYARSTNYFTLPKEFFLDDWHSRLELPATVVLLIGLLKSRQDPWFELRTDRESHWYGISADSLYRGLDQLRVEKLLEVRLRQVKDPRARFGLTAVNEYRLNRPFATPGA